MYLKAVLFLLSGSLASVTILIEFPSLRLAFLLVVAIWSFARLYYFCFYVLERYIDPSFKFAGLGPLALHLLRQKFRVH